jgi:dihydroxy-acid dehydratase
LMGDGDRISINIRAINLDLPEEETIRRRVDERLLGRAGWQPRNRKRAGSIALQAYAALTTSAARGAVRDVNRRRSEKRRKLAGP